MPSKRPGGKSGSQEFLASLPSPRTKSAAHPPLSARPGTCNCCTDGVAVLLSSSIRAMAPHPRKVKSRCAARGLYCTVCSTGKSMCLCVNLSRGRGALPTDPDSRRLQQPRAPLCRSIPIRTGTAPRVENTCQIGKSLVLSSSGKQLWISKVGEDQ